MSSSVGGKVTVPNEPFSITRLNRKFVTRMTGTEIGNHPISADPLNILCIEDGAGYKKGRFYTISDDGVLYDTFLDHTHVAAGEGGSYYDIKQANYSQLVEVDRSLGVIPEEFTFTRTNAGTWAMVVDGVSNQRYGELKTGIVANDVSNLQYGGGRLFFGKPITFQAKHAITHNIDISYRMGLNQPLIESNAGTNAQIGFSGCSGDGPLNGIFSASGSIRSTEWMSNMVQPNPLGLRFDYYPSAKIVAVDGLGVKITKITDLPGISTATNGNATLRFGVKTTNTTAKAIRLYSFRLLGYSYDQAVGSWV
jgi:hypothetical protein